MRRLSLIIVLFVVCSSACKLPVVVTGQLCLSDADSACPTGEVCVTVEKNYCDLERDGSTGSARDDGRDPQRISDRRGRRVAAGPDLLSVTGLTGTARLTATGRVGDKVGTPLSANLLAGSLDVGAGGLRLETDDGVTSTLTVDGAARFTGPPGRLACVNVELGPGSRSNDPTLISTSSGCIDSGITGALSCGDLGQ